MITPTQLRMARAALALTLQQLGARVRLSAVAMSRYEAGDRSVMSVATIDAIEAFFRAQGLAFGPSDGVCLGDDVFAQRCLPASCYHRLLEEAYARARQQGGEG